MVETRTAPYAALLLRVALGVMFLAHGLTKLLVFTLPGTAQFFAKIGFAGWLATGSLGVVRLVSVGPSPLLVGAAAFVTVAVGAAMVVPWPTRHADTVDD